MRKAGMGHQERCSVPALFCYTVSMNVDSECERREISWFGNGSVVK